MLLKIYKFLPINRIKKILIKKILVKNVLMKNKWSIVIMSWECITENKYWIAGHATMVMKAHFALLAFIVCTSYTSLRPSWLSVHTSQRPVHFPQISLLVPTSQRKACTSQSLLSPYKIKYQCALLKYWCAILKTSTAQSCSIALRTSENSTV